MPGLVIFALPAAAASRRLDWSAPASCPPESALRVELTRLLGESAVETGSFDASARVTAAGDGRFSLVLTVHSAAGEGTRTLTADTCESLVKVAAFSIALAVNPDLSVDAAESNPTATAPEDSPTPEPSPGPESNPAAPSSGTSLKSPASSPPPDTPSADAPSPELWLGARIVADSSLLPSPALGFGASADAVFLDAVRFGLAAQGFIPQTELLPNGAGGHFTLWSLEGHACYDVRLPVRLSFCPLVQWILVHGTGRGVAEELERRSSSIALGGAVAGRLLLAPRVAGVLSAAAVVPLSVDYFVVTAGQVHEMPSISGQAILGIEFSAF